MLFNHLTLFCKSSLSSVKVAQYIINPVSHTVSLNGNYIYKREENRQVSPLLSSRCTKPLFLGSSFTAILLLSDSSSVSLHPNRAQHPPLYLFQLMFTVEMKAFFSSEIVAFFNECLALGALSFNFAFCEAFPATQSQCGFLIWAGLALWICGAPNGTSANSKPLKCCWFRPKCIRRCQELLWPP